MSGSESRGRRWRMRAAAAAGLLQMMAQGAAAQVAPQSPEGKPDERDSTRDLAPRGPEVDSIGPTTPPASTPVQPGLRGMGAIPGLMDADYRVTRGQVLREGTFLVARRGSMLRIPSGEWVFVFHKDDRGNAERPMILLPSQGLSRMQQAAGERPQDNVFTVSGQVFAYHSRNYLLPDVFSVATAGAGAEASGGAGGEGGGAAPSPVDDPGVQSLIKELERERDRPRTISLRNGGKGAPGKGGEGAPAASGDPAGVLGEGTFLIRRRGRLVRQGGGEWALVFDADAAADAAADPPMVVAPCMNLERMEALAASQGEALGFEVSGRVLTYQGRNYLSPGLFQVLRSGDVKPRK